MKASDYIAAYLDRQGVRQVFLLVGGMITHLVDSIATAERIQLVSVQHEQAAAFAAEATARMTGVPGVAMATSGPGATNLLTGIGSCYFDSTPAVFITGQVNRNELKGSRPIRQLGFQETDIVAMAAPITKAAWQVQSAAELPAVLDAAFQLALSGRPGPVLLDIPMDVQRETISEQPPGKLSVVPAPVDSTCRQRVDDLVHSLASARRPLILAGGGIRSAHAVEQFRRFVDRAKIPVVYSLMGVDTLPSNHPQRIGLIGSYGNRWANLAFGSADFLLVLGSRLDIRQTGADTVAFKGERTIFHVDCDRGEINNRVTDCVALVAELSPLLGELGVALDGHPLPSYAAWLAEINRLREQWPDTAELASVAGINPNQFMHDLAQASQNAAAYVIDVGQHQMWAAQSLEIGPQQRLLTSGGMGAMGFALPAAIGAALACRKPVVLLAGDGGFQLNIQELQTVVRSRLPLKMVILNNHAHGMVRQFQQSYFSARYHATSWGYSAPDFAKVAEGYGVAAATVDDPAGLPKALDQLWADPTQPFLLQVMIDSEANVYPKIAFGHPLTEMEPFVQPIEMEAT